MGAGGGRGSLGIGGKVYVDFMEGEGWVDLVVMVALLSISGVLGVVVVGERLGVVGPVEGEGRDLLSGLL